MTFLLPCWQLMQSSRFIFIAMMMLFTAPVSWAHFQLIYAPSYILDKPGKVPTKLIFWHPMENGYAMPMVEPEQVLMFHRGKRLDISSHLQTSQFFSNHNQVDSWDVDIPIRRAGDYVVAVIPQPYYEESEDIFIQQITKAYFNRKQLPTDWQEEQGLTTEIKPLVKPYNVIEGSNFSGIVLSQGQPVPFAEIEVEYMPAEPNMDNSSIESTDTIALPGGSISIQSDAHGVFSMTLPKAGFWGFAALGSGPDKQFQGKSLSQDAVIWVQVHQWP